MLRTLEFWSLIFILFYFDFLTMRNLYRVLWLNSLSFALSRALLRYSIVSCFLISPLSPICFYYHVSASVSERSQIPLDPPHLAKSRIPWVIEMLVFAIKRQENSGGRWCASPGLVSQSWSEDQFISKRKKLQMGLPESCILLHGSQGAIRCHWSLGHVTVCPGSIMTRHVSLFIPFCGLGAL